MRKIIASLMLAAAASTVLVVAEPTSASATDFWGTPHVVTSADVIQIVNALPSSWDVKGAARFVDQYTASRMTFVNRCGHTYRCIVIKPGHLTGNQIAYSSGNGASTITVDIWRASKTGQFNAATRRWLVAHELGHKFGFAHSKSCHNVMYPWRRCGSKIPWLAFSAAQIRALRRG